MVLDQYIGLFLYTIQREANVLVYDGPWEAENKNFQLQSVYE